MPTPTRTLSEDDVARFSAERCFSPPGSGRVGLELEFLTFPIADRGRRIDLERLRDAVAGTLPLPASGRVTFEPGGQLELSTVPHADVATAIAATHQDLATLAGIAADAGVELVAIGADHWRPPARLVDTPRYRAMEAHFDQSGTAGRRMMCNTAALQVNLDLGPPHLMPARWRAAYALGPVLAAAFANSPGAGIQSQRLATWLEVDAERSAPVSTVEDHPASAWAEYALDACAWFAGGLPLGEALPFRDWLRDGHDVGFPDIDDLAYHMTTLFPPVRPRGWLEIRYLDALPSPWWEVAAKVVDALLSDDAIPDTLLAAGPGQGRWWAAARAGLEDDALASAADACFALASDATGDAGVEEYRTRYVARRVPAWT